MPFKKGEGGRPRGVQNKATVEIKEASRLFLADKAGQLKMLQQYQNGELNPYILALLHYYAFGKPKERMEFEDKTPRPLVIDRVSTREEMLKALGAKDIEAGEEDDD
jgi:hypothetical protein